MKLTITIRIQVLRVFIALSRQLPFYAKASSPDVPKAPSQHGMLLDASLMGTGRTITQLRKRHGGRVHLELTQSISNLQAQKEEIEKSLTAQRVYLYSLISAIKEEGL